jgi:hypothetical protein
VIVDRGQRKRLADICEKLGVVLFVGAALQAIMTEAFALRPLIVAGVAARGFILLVIAIRLSKET